MKIYELVHMHRAEVLSDGRFHCGDIAILGFFKSLDEVSTTIKFYKNIEGFRNYPNGFVVFEHEIEGDEASIYVAFFYMHDEEYEFEYSRDLGIFTCESDACHAIKNFRQNNLINWDNDKLVAESGVDKYVLGEMNCTDGFEF
ncbi:MAG: hypothetical protein ACLU3M_00150 [Oscillospiraceae bacterium]|jgi:hypothetical protein